MRELRIHERLKSVPLKAAPLEDSDPVTEHVIIHHELGRLTLPMVYCDENATFTNESWITLNNGLELKIRKNPHNENYHITLYREGHFVQGEDLGQFEVKKTEHLRNLVRMLEDGWIPKKQNFDALEKDGKVIIDFDPPPGRG